jgi:hypothetical protein
MYVPAEYPSHPFTPNTGEDEDEDYCSVCGMMVGAGLANHTSAPTLEGFCTSDEELADEMELADNPEIAANIAASRAANSCGSILRDAIRNSTFLAAYVEAMVFTSMSADEDEMGDATIDDFSLSLATRTIADCNSFETANYDLISDDLSRAGHAFWLTRNHHGAGFWDGDWDETIGETLTEASHGFGEVEILLGDDGLVYA